MQQAPEVLCELVEPLFIPFGEHLLSHKRPARPTPTEHYWQLETPATETSSPRPHTQLRIARTHETKRFPGWTHPPTSDNRQLESHTPSYTWQAVGLNGAYSDPNGRTQRQDPTVPIVTNIFEGGELVRS